MKKTKSKWSSETKKIAGELHSKLSINDENWHKLKSDSDHRAAELLSGAIAQLLNGGAATDVEDLARQAIKWLRKEIVDKGCPSKSIN